jgi:hypothetical protein
MGQTPPCVENRFCASAQNFSHLGNQGSQTSECTHEACYLEIHPLSELKVKSQFNSEDDKQNESTRKLPSIMLAMGADHVEAVFDEKHTASKTSKYDFVLVKDAEDVKKFNSTGKGDRPPCVHIPWVKECLVAGKLLDIPDV